MIRILKLKIITFSLLLFTQVGIAVDRYIDNNDGTILDTETGLMWQKSDDGNEYGWYEAHAYADNLNVAGYSDWRLPSLDELRNLIVCTDGKIPEKVLSDYCGSGNYITPTINPIFECRSSIYYWSSNSYADDTDSAWFAYFGSGRVGNRPKGYDFLVRCVRSETLGPLLISVSANEASGLAPLKVSFSCSVTSGIPPFSFAYDFGDGAISDVQNAVHTFTSLGTYTVVITATDAKGQTAQKTQSINVTARWNNRYIDNGDGTVSDTGTGLMWQKFDDDVTRYWDEAQTYADNLTLAGYSDWRLPTIDELRGSIVCINGKHPDKYELCGSGNYTTPTIDPIFYTGGNQYHYWYWSSSTYSYADAWYVHLYDGHVTTMGKENGHYVRCVRSGTLESENSNETCVPAPTSEKTVILITGYDVATAPVQYSITPSALSSSIGFETNFPCYLSAVDIYLLMIDPSGTLFFINSENAFTEEFVPYATNMTEALIISELNAGSAVDGNSTLGWFVAPANGGDVGQSLVDGKYELGAYILTN